MDFDHITRFKTALTAWVASDAKVLEITGHNGTTVFRVYTISGDEQLERNSLLIDLLPTIPAFEDLDEWHLTEVHFIAYCSSQDAALNLAGAVRKLLRQDPTTYQDAGFSANNIKTMGCRVVKVDRAGKEQFEPTSVRRTERSDVPMPDRNVAIVGAIFRWTDTTS